MQYPSLYGGPPVSGPHGQDVARIAYTRRSRRILYGEHEQDVIDRLQEQLGAVRREAWGVVDLSSNPCKLVWSSLATLYDRWPTVTGDDDLSQHVADAGLWPLMSRVQRDALALREMWLRVDVAELPDGEHELVYEPIYPDMVVARDASDRPGIPVELYHARRRETASGLEWMWDHIDISDPSAPTYRVVRAARQGETGSDLVDVSADYGVAGWPDTWRDAAGHPVLPMVLYHAARTPRIYDPYQTRELVEGTLTACLMRTHLLHVIKQASWAQRYAVNARVQGLGYSDEDGDGHGRSSVITDPATVLLLESVSEDQASPQVGQWTAPSNPQDLMTLIEAYERKLMAESGVRPDVTRSSGDPRSAVALTVDRDSQREAQRRFEPQFRRGDAETLRLSAIMLNRASGSSYAEGGYKLVYHGVPQSAQERKAQREHLLSLLEAGLTDPVSAYQELHPGTTDEQALTALARIREIRALLQPAALSPAAADDRQEAGDGGSM